MYYGGRSGRGCSLALCFVLFVPQAFAASGVCQAGWEWIPNSKAQNPCEIAGALEAECRGLAAYVLGPLSQGTNYVTPQKNTSEQKCQCNTVMFSLYMACTACQNVSTEPWSFWDKFCDQVYVAQYPETIPLNTAVPNWAYLDYTKGDKFDPAAAKAAGDQPERLARVPSTVSLSDRSTSSSSPSSTSTSLNSVSSGGSQDNNSQTKTSVPPSLLSSTGSVPSSIVSSAGSGPSSHISSPDSSSSLSTTSVSTGDGQQNSGQTKKSSPTVGVIVGGVVGGLVFLAAVGVGVWAFLGRRKASGGVHPTNTEHSSEVALHENGMQPPEMRLYDPSDPFTFPRNIDHRSGVYTPSFERPNYTGSAEL